MRPWRNETKHPEEITYPIMRGRRPEQLGLNLATAPVCRTRTQGHYKHSTKSTGDIMVVGFCRTLEQPSTESVPPAELTYLFGNPCWGLPGIEEQGFVLIPSPRARLGARAGLGPPFFRRPSRSPSG